MSFRIGRWNCTYCVMDTQPQALLAADALEQRVRRSVLDAFEATLTAALANDPTVYVVRRLDVKFAMQVTREPNVVALARRWGAHIGAQAVHAIAGDADSANVQRFENQADFVAHFLADMLRGYAWQRWCYGAFARFRHMPQREIVLTILRQHQQLLPAIFRYLALLGSLRALLDLLDDDDAATLMHEAMRRPTREMAVTELRVFVRAALQISGALGLWTSAPLDEANLIEIYAATRPPPPDWTDRQSLAAAVWSILRFVEQRGQIAIAGRAGAQERWNAHAAEFAAALDWFDLNWLREILVGSPRELIALQRTRETSSGDPTPNQKRLLTRLSQILIAAAIPLDRAHPDSESNALRLYAALAATDPDLAAQPGAISIVKLLLAAWGAISQIEDPIAALQQLHDGRIPSTANDLSREQAQALRMAAALGGPAADVIRELIANNPIALGTPACEAMETASAGLFLMVRAITDLGIAPPAPILFALGLQWSGALESDPALLLWSGLTQPEPTSEILNRLDHALCDSLLARVENVVKNRSSVDPESAIISAIPADWTAVLTETCPSNVQLPSSIAPLAVHLLHLWARWLRGFSRSSAPYLMRQFIRRPGRIEVRADEIAVTLPAAPLDPVLEMSGYLAATPVVPWLSLRRVTFRIDKRHA